VPFNESWGVWQEIYSSSIKRFREKIVKMTKELDPTRLVVDNSGWLHKETDILDIHQYLPSVKKTELLYKELARPWNCIFSKSSLKLEAGFTRSNYFSASFPWNKISGRANCDKRVWWLWILSHKASLVFGKLSGLYSGDWQISLPAGILLHSAL